jgi:hypothetical protein
MSANGATGETKVLASNVECEGLFLISRGSGPLQPLSVSEAVRTPEAHHVEPHDAPAAAAFPKTFLVPSTPPAVPASAWSQSSYGSKVSLTRCPCPRVQFLHPNTPVAASAVLKNGSYTPDITRQVAPCSFRPFSQPERSPMLPQGLWVRPRHGR